MSLSIVTRLLLPVLLAGGLIAPHAGAAAPTIPIAAFAQEDQFSAPRLSPDGKHIAITVRMARNGRMVPTITIYSLPALQIVGATQFPAFEAPLSYSWVSNTRLVVAKARESGALDQPAATGELLAMNLDGSKQEYLYGYDMQRQSRFGDRYVDTMGFGAINSTSAKHDGHFLMSTHTVDNDHSMLYDVNAVSTTRKLLADVPHPGLEFLVQNDGTPRFAYGEARDTNSNVLFRRDDASGAWIAMSAQQMQGHLIPLAFAPDDASFFAIHSAKGEARELVQVDMKSGVQRSVLRDSEGNIGHFQFGPEHDLPFAAASTIGIPSARYLDDSASAKLHKLLSSKFPGAIVEFIDYTDDGSKLLFVAHSDREPGAYFLYDRASGKALPLFASREQIDPAQMAERRPFQFQSRDGLTIHGFLTLPAGPRDGKLAAVLLPHGGPHGIADQWTFDNDAQFLASRGYAVIQVNFRGSGGRGGAFIEAGFREWGGKIQDDLIDGLDWAIAHAEIDPARVCVYGASFGGYSALMLGARDGARFRCAVGYAGVYDLALLYTKGDIKGSERGLDTLNDYVGKDPAQLARFSPAKLAERITLPVLLVHGEKDERAPFAHALAMRAALQAQQRPPEWMAVPDEGHGFYAVSNTTAFYARLEAFLAKHLAR